MSLQKLIDKANKLNRACCKVKKQIYALGTEVETELKSLLPTLPDDYKVAAGWDPVLEILFIEFYFNYHYIHRFEIDTTGDVEKNFQDKKEKIEQFIATLTSPVEPAAT